MRKTHKLTALKITDERTGDSEELIIKEAEKKG